MNELWELTTLIRSKNAGPFELTFDVIMKDRESFERVLASGVLSAQRFAELYGLPADAPRVFVHERVLAIKISLPRPVFSGDSHDTDVFGGQFHGPLVRQMIGEPVAAGLAANDISTKEENNASTH